VIMAYRKAATCIMPQVSSCSARVTGGMLLLLHICSGPDLDVSFRLSWAGAGTPMSIMLNCLCLLVCKGWMSGTYHPLVNPVAM
jgi:hypothetical protein